MFLSSKLEHRRWRVSLATATFMAALVIVLIAGFVSKPSTQTPTTSGNMSSSPASKVLAELLVKPVASSAGYARTDFGGSWAEIGDCDMREHILNRDITNVVDRSATDCTVLSGTFNDPYTGQTINFVRGPGTSEAVQIDHVVALGDAWRTGAQQLSQTTREQMYNDPLELLAASGPANDEKGDADASGWLPPNKAYDCRYVARQIAVKLKYHLWVTPDEHTAMAGVLSTCPTQQLPTVSQQ